MKVAKTSFAGSYNGMPYVVSARQTIDDGHPIVRDNPEMFEEYRASIRWEEATANPNEQRSVSPSPSVDDGDDEEDDDDGEEDLVSEDLPLSELLRIAKVEKVSSAGTKAELARRINAKRVRG